MEKAILVKIMTKGELMDMITDCARRYCPSAAKSIMQNMHMNRYTGEVISQSTIDALIVDFINYIAKGQGLDLGLYTKHLKRKNAK